MKSIKYLLILLALLFVMTQCKKEDTGIPHPEVVTGEYNPQNGVAIGTIRHLSRYVAEYGHIWDTIMPTIDTFRNRSIHTDIPMQDSAQIISTISGLQADETYFIRAYVVDEFGNPWYGNIVIQYNPSDYVKACLTSSHTECEIHECGVRFDATCSDGDTLTYKWDFNGDNVFDHISNTEIADHIYTTPGTYYPRLYVVNNRNIADDTIFTLQVYETEQTLTPCFLAAPDTAEVGSTIAFDASCSENAVYYEWDFNGDGLLDAFGSEAITGTYTYNEPGNFTAKLTVKNTDGVTATDSTQIQINPPAPVTPTACFFASITEAEAGTEIEFYASCSQNAFIYRWDFDGNGVPEMGGVGMETVTWTFDTADDYDVRLEVVSVDDITDADIITITINPPTLITPTACLVEQPPTSVLTNETIYLDASCSQNAVNYKWNFGDGTILNGSQWEVASHAYGEVGNYEVTLTTRSIDGEEAEFTTSEIQCSAPPPKITTIFISDMEDICPRHIGGNRDFDGAGPNVTVNCEAIFNDSEIYIHVHFNLIQTTDDWTEGEFDDYIKVYDAPEGKKIIGILSDTQSSTFFEDIDDNTDVVPGTEGGIVISGNLVDRFIVIGDTSGDDVPAANDVCSEFHSELNIYFNPMTIELVDE